MDIKTAQVDADDVEQLKALFNDYKPELVINLALLSGPYHNGRLSACGCNYLDTANYEPKDEAHFEYSWQWAYKGRFEQSQDLQPFLAAASTRRAGRYSRGRHRRFACA